MTWHLKPLQESALNLKVCIHFTHLHTCYQLISTELDLQSCSHLQTSALHHVKDLKCLQRLNLYKINLTSNVITDIGKYVLQCTKYSFTKILYSMDSNCTAIKHLNLGASCINLTNEEVNRLNITLSNLK